MLKPLIRTAAITSLILVIAGGPIEMLAQDKPAKPAAEKKPTEEKKPSAGPFHGKLAAVDKGAKTITVGKRTFHVTSETKINKGGKPATLNDGVVGEEVSGYVKPTDDGKLVATKINFGPKSEPQTTKTEEKKKEK